MTFSKRLKESRKSKGLTLSELGEKINKTEATIQRYESGNIKNLKNDTIEELALALNVSPAYLMGWDNQPQQTTKAAHLENEDLTDEEWEELEKYIEFIKLKRKKN